MNDAEGKGVIGNKLRRKAWVAALLSFLLSGLGQMYNGQLRKGLAFYLAETVVVLFLLPAGKSLPFALLAAVLLLAAAIRLTALIEAAVTARQIGSNFRPAQYNRPAYYIGGEPRDVV